jgi:hypothetical protein
VSATASDEQQAADAAANHEVATRMAQALRPTTHNVTGLVPVLCPHGCMLVVEPDDLAPWLLLARVSIDGQDRGQASPLADGRRVVTPRSGRTFVRAKYATGTFACVVDRGDPRPDDLTTPGAFRPIAGVCSQPVRLWVPEPYDPAVHGPLLPQVA